MGIGPATNIRIFPRQNRIGSRFALQNRKQANGSQFPDRPKETPQRLRRLLAFGRIARRDTRERTENFAHGKDRDAAHRRDLDAAHGREPGTSRTGGIGTPRTGGIGTPRTGENQDAAHGREPGRRARKRTGTPRTEENRDAPRRAGAKAEPHIRIRNGVKIMPPAEKRSFFLIFAP